MKNILLLVHDDVGQESRLQAALDLTRALSGHLICLDVVEPPVLVGTDFAVSGLEATFIEEARDREGRHLAAINTRLESENVSWNCQQMIGDIALSLEDRTLIADVIVLNTYFDVAPSPDMQTIVSDVVMKSGTLVLAVPASDRAFEPGGHALIGWNGSAEISRTVRAATPLLQLAQRVTLIEIGRNEGTPIDEAAAYLSRHDINSRIEYRSATGAIATELMTVVKDIDPAYCVLGAYGHSRMRQALFGGVTRHMLFESPVPLLLGR